jgi:hypothetical protein
LPAIKGFAQVEHVDAHPPENCDPLVSLGLVVGETVDLVEQSILVEGGNHKHVFAPWLHPHCEVLHRHLRQSSTAAGA